VVAVEVEDDAEVVVVVEGVVVVVKVVVDVEVVRLVVIVVKTVVVVPVLLAEVVGEVCVLVWLVEVEPGTDSDEDAEEVEVP